MKFGLAFLSRLDFCGFDLDSTRIIAVKKIGLGVGEGKT